MAFSCLEIAEKTHTDQSILLDFYTIGKEKTHNPSKEEAAKKVFSSLHVTGTTCVDECFLFYMMTGRHYFL